MALLGTEYYDFGEDNCVIGQLNGLTYKYDTHTLPSLSLLDFCRVLITGRSCQVRLERFDRTLSKRTCKLPEFTVQTIEQSRSLNRPRLLVAYSEATNDRPFGGRMQPFVSGVITHPLYPHLIPAGTYLSGHVE